MYQLSFYIFCADFDELQFNASPEEFTSKKITTKILQQIEVSLYCRFMKRFLSAEGK